MNILIINAVLDKILTYNKRHNLWPRQSDLLKSNGMSRPTLKKYLDYMQAASIIKFNGQRIEITNAKRKAANAKARR